MTKNAMPPSMKLPKAVGLLGGGVIGGAWAARFLLSGVNVKLYDPAPGAADAVLKMVNDARRAYKKLGMSLPAREGTMTLVDTVEEAVRDVDLVQESIPERLDLKHKLLQKATRAAVPDLLICSSTSGFMPSELQDGVAHPERVIVAHPFNPVYLLPLVELCGGPRAPVSALQRAAEFFRAIGMHTLIMRKEIGGFIANRIQEAIWRECLWLVKDDIATPEECDDAISYSFGLRLAIKGPFHSGGGGEALRKGLESWPPELRGLWTNFPAPEHDQAFVDKLAALQDARTDKSTSVELLAKRDECLVGILQTLRAADFGAGRSYTLWEEALRAQAAK
ncbi:3-hydroxyacyl-CoA dehydrogenase NAD-binding domain-containing protein [Bradyrhizobium forestalis]|nr:3-hydroxyacyl-CoA dehydrogenase NAD-binding domain-containing protein [Bradyrhizobium forestalis]